MSAEQESERAAGTPGREGRGGQERERQGEAVVMTATSVTCVVMTAISVALGSARFSTHLHTSRWMTMQALADQQLELLKKAVDAGQCTTGEKLDFCSTSTFVYIAQTRR